MKTATIEFGKTSGDSHAITIDDSGNRSTVTVRDDEWESYQGSRCERIAAILGWMDTEFDGDTVHCLSDWRWA
jgi:hypothetical protein